MKANEFIKKFGWDFSKSCIENMVLSVGSFGGCVCVPKDLKRLVDSHELVKDYYGLTRAKEHAESNYTAPELRAALKQAIADVESCQ